MTPLPPRVRTWTLAREEIRALPRSSFGMGAVAVGLGLVLMIAAFGLEGEDAMGEFLLFLWLVALLVVAVVLAARIASARCSRFVDSLYTTPLQQRTWLAAQTIVGGVLVLLVLAAQLPFILVHVLLVGVPPELLALFVAALAVGACVIALGLFCGVVVGDAGPGAAAGLAGGLAFLWFILFLVHGLGVTMPPSPTSALILRLSALSPLALATDVTGTSPFDALPADTWRPVLGLLALAVGLAGAAWLAYTREQGPLGWERGGGRTLVVALVALAVLAPVASSATSFHEEEDVIEIVYSPGESTRVGIVARGAAITDEAFTLSGFFDAPDLTYGQDDAVDVLVMVLALDHARVQNVRVVVEGSERVQVVGGGSLHVADGVPEGHARPPTGNGWAPDEKAAARPVYRVPVVLRALEVNALMGTHAPLAIDTAFTAQGRAHGSLARISIETNVENASAILALAGAPLPLAALATIARRKLATR